MLPRYVQVLGSKVELYKGFAEAGIQFVKVLGVGGFGTVHLVQWKGQQWAMKVVVDHAKVPVQYSLGCMVKAALPDRLQTIAGIQRVFCVRTAHKAYACCLMPVAPAETLSEFLKKQARGLAPALVHLVTLQLLVGLHFLHIAKGVSHGDVKPHNVCIDPMTGQVMLIDTDSCGPVGSAAGAYTFAYMAPETADPVYRARSIAQDMWSCGLVVYEALQGEGTHAYVPPAELEQALDAYAAVAGDGPAEREALEWMAWACMTRPLRLDRVRLAAALGDHTGFARWHDKQAAAAEYAEGMRQLVCGLLCVDPHERWGWAQVYESAVMSPDALEALKERFPESATEVDHFLAMQAQYLAQAEASEEEEDHVEMTQSAVEAEGPAQAPVSAASSQCHSFTAFNTHHGDGGCGASPRGTSTCSFHSCCSAAFSVDCDDDGDDDISSNTCTTSSNSRSSSTSGSNSCGTTATLSSSRGVSSSAASLASTTASAAASMIKGSPAPADAAAAVSAGRVHRKRRVLPKLRLQHKVERLLERLLELCVL